MENRKAIIALVLICIIWGTTYLFLKIGVNNMDPFFFSGIRQVSAGVILLLLLKIMRKYDGISRKQLIHQSIAGILMITLGNGLVAYAEVVIPSSIAAIICATMPVWVGMINVFTPGSVKLSKIGYFAIVIGIVGVMWLFSDSIDDFGNVHYLAGIFVTLLATVAWIGGSYILKSGSMNYNPFVNTSIQMIVGGLGLFIASWIMGESYHFSVTFEGWFALIYLILIGSLVAMASYSYALKHLPMQIVSIYAYINPVVAIVLGWVFLGESMTLSMLGACLVIVMSVVLLNLPMSKKSKVGYELSTDTKF